MTLSRIDIRPVGNFNEIIQVSFKTFFKNCLLNFFCVCVTVCVYAQARVCKHGTCVEIRGKLVGSPVNSRITLIMSGLAVPV